jgi:hypothetical protein
MSPLGVTQIRCDFITTALLHTEEGFRSGMIWIYTVEIMVNYKEQWGLELGGRIKSKKNTIERRIFLRCLVVVDDSKIQVHVVPLENQPVIMHEKSARLLLLLPLCCWK